MNPISERQRRIVGVVLLALAALEFRLAYLSRHIHPWLALADVLVAFLLAAGVIYTW